MSPLYVVLSMQEQKGFIQNGGNSLLDNSNKYVKYSDKIMSVYFPLCYI